MRKYITVICCFSLLLPVWVSAAPTLSVTGNVLPTVDTPSLDQGDWSVGDHLYVGNTGIGTISLSAGAQVSNLYGIAGLQVGSDGDITITDSGSLWQCQGTALIGQSGSGSLILTQGGDVTSTDGQLGYGTTGIGSVRVTDSGSRWDITRSLTVAGLGQADLTIQQGGRLVAGNGVVGQFQGAIGTVTISGTDSLLATTGYGDSALVIGDAGQGGLSIEDGAVVVSGKGYVARSSTGYGEVVLRGTGSRWSNHAGDLYVGGSASGAGGQALLDIGTGATVDADAVVIETQGILQGAGQLTARDNGTTLKGTLKPGNGIGTLTIAGDLTIAAGSTVQIEVDNQGQSDLLNVTQDVVIEGGTFQAVSTETITESRVYTVVQADRIQGHFDILDTALLQTEQGATAPALGYADQAITLCVNPRPFADADLVETANQSAVATALQTIADAGGSTLTTQLQQLGEDAQVRAAYDQLSGQSQLSVAPVTTTSTDRFQGVVSGRLAQARSHTNPMLASGSSNQNREESNPIGPVMALGNATETWDDHAWGFWGKGYGLFGDRETQANAAGYGYTVGGGGLGLDYQISSTWLIGVTGGFSQGEIDYTNEVGTDFDGTYVGLYGTYDRESWYVDGVFTWAQMDYQTQRSINLGTPESLQGQFGGDEVSASVEAGCDWPQVSDWHIQPLVGLRFSQVTLDDYTETGGSSALHYERQRRESLRSSVGAKLTRTLFASDLAGTGALQVRACWNHEFGDTESTVDTSFASNPGVVFTVTDENLSRDSGTLGAGFYLQMGESTQLRLDYDTRFSQDDQSHLVTAQVEVRW